MAKSKHTRASAAESLLVELLTEELPPKALQRISQAFRDALLEDLKKDGFLMPGSTARVFATPRRLAVLISEVRNIAPDSEVMAKGPSVRTGLDAGGQPTQALLKFAEKRGVPVEALVRINDGKQEVFAHRDLAKGAHLETSLEPKVEEALKRLPIPKMMRWGGGEDEFVRPVHGLVMLHGSRVVPGRVLGLSSSNATTGHRFLSNSAITLRRADDYERALRDKGKVIGDFAERRSQIVNRLEKAAGGDAIIVADDALLDEIAALVESPAVYAGKFSAEFLAVPHECLVLAMQQHQRYVPLREKETGKLLPRFLFVANLETRQPREIIRGNERVLRARLADAKFFYDQDRKTRLETRVPRLANVVYHNRLGSQLERVERIQLLAGRIARGIGADPLLAERAAWLSKADLLTEMVGEFPELQGIMGGYYARNDGEKQHVAEALADQYRSRFDEAKDAANLVSACLYLADRLDSLIGMFGIGEKPTGEKDPYALRRAALGVIGVYDQLAAIPRLGNNALPDVREFLDFAVTLFSSGRISTTAAPEVHDFILDRCWYQLATTYPKNVVESVISRRPPLAEVSARVRAVEEFRRREPRRRKQADPQHPPEKRSRYRVSRRGAAARAGRAGTARILEERDAARIRAHGRPGLRRGHARDGRSQGSGRYFFRQGAGQRRRRPAAQQPPRAAARARRPHEPGRGHFQARRLRTRES
jgi:glycyl-tRNA synthetase beta chain